MGRKNAGRKGKYTGANRCRFDPMLCWGYADWIKTHEARSQIRHGKPDRRRDIDEVVERHVAAWGKAEYTRREIAEAAARLRTALAERRCA